MAMLLIPNEEEIKVKYVIENWFNARFKILSTLQYESNIENYIFSEKDFLKEKLYIQLEIENRKKQPFDYKFHEFNYELIYRGITFKNHICYVILFENHYIYFNFIKNYCSITQNLKHEIILYKKGTDWFIKTDNYTNNNKRFIEDLLERFKDIDKVKSFIIEDKKLNDYYLENKNQNYHHSLRNYKYYYYNASAAVNYAIKYAMIPNVKQFKDYTNLGGDCTNFISQCLYAGGLPKDYVDPYTWYWDSDTHRANWTGVNDLYTYLVNNNSSSSHNFGVYAYSSNHGTVSLGHVVQLSDSKGVWYHSMIIVQEIERSSNDTVQDYLVAQHSDNGIYPLSSKMGKKRYIHIDGYYK